MSAENEAIERVARAIYMDTAYAGMPVEPTDEWDEVDERLCKSMARAAIEAHKAALADAGYLIVARETVAPSRSAVG